MPNESRDSAHMTRAEYQRSIAAKQTKTKKRRSFMSRKKQRLMIMISAIAVLIVFLVRGCTADKRNIVGTWNLDNVTMYTFHKDKTGELSVPSATYEFIYKIDHDQLSIDFINEQANDMTYTFDIQKELLLLVGEGDNIGYTFELTKVDTK